VRELAAAMRLTQQDGLQWLNRLHAAGKIRPHQLEPTKPEEPLRASDQA